MSAILTHGREVKNIWVFLMSDLKTVSQQFLTLSQTSPCFYVSAVKVF